MTDTRTPAQQLVQDCLDRSVDNPFDGHPTDVLENAAEVAEKEAEAFRRNSKGNLGPLGQILVERFSEVAEDIRTEIEARARLH